MMRVCCLFGLLMAVGCGKQLNPEYCLHNPTDGDCLDAGLVFIDAPAPCSSNAACMTDPDKSVCDVDLGACVHCTPTSHAACTGDTTVCTTDDVCVGCDQNSQCPSNICLTGTGTCAAPGDVLFANVTPTGTGSCLSDTNRCTLATALTKARVPGGGHVISMATGDYHEGPLTLDIANLQIIAAAGQAVTITDNANGPVFNVTVGPALIQNVTIYGALNADAINCTNATLTLDEVTLQDNPKAAIKARNCTLTVDRSRQQRNHDRAMDIDDTQLVTRNSVFVDNGNNNLDDGTVKLGNGTTGEFRFNTVAFNSGKNGGGPGPQPTSGLYCNVINGNFKILNATDNLFADNPGAQIAKTNWCDTSRSWAGSSTTVKFTSTAKPYDVHLTSGTPTTNPNAIRDNGNANCGNVTHDYDNAARPYNQACDIGAYEFRP
jgi:hypothetical protein